jgi:phytoene dehydrogenase-like protein
VPRRFRGLKQPNDSYDAVVIGAGVGGLVCANLLARSGLKVLLIEQHFMVGGYCSTFRRHKFTFDAATHFYPLLGNPSTITGSLLTELGVTTEWVKMDPVDCFHFPDGSCFSVPANLDDYLNKLKLEFPDENENIDAFFTLARKAYLIGLAKYFRNVETSRIAPYQNLSIRDVLQQHFHNEKLKLLLTGDIGHWGSPPSRTSFVFDSMLRLAYFLGNYYPKGGSQAFVDELAQRFEEAGGHILMSSMVRRILIENHAACGVEVELGSLRHKVTKRVTAGVVVSNADLLQMVEQMIDPEFMDPNWLTRVKQLRPSLPCFLLHIGVNGIPLADLKPAEGYHWNSWDAEDVATHAFKVFLPTSFDPSLAPPGGQVVIVQKVTAVDFDCMDWAEHKAQVENYLLQSLERRIPGFCDHIVTRFSASAYTSYRYTLNHHGAMLGWEMSPDQLGELRPGVEGPVKNLYLVGHWVRPGGGVTPVMISALQAARRIIGGSRPHIVAAPEVAAAAHGDILA